MKKFFILLGTLLIYFGGNSQNVGIGTPAPNASAKLDVTSTNSGLLPPRMTTTERDAIASPAAGLMIYNTSSNAIEFYNGSTWVSLANTVYANKSLKKLFGGSAGDFIYASISTTDGGYILAGYSGSSNTGTLAGIFTHGSSDCWIIKLDVNGNIQWQKLLGGSQFDQARSIRQTSDGGYLVAGFSNSSNTGTLIGTTTNGNYDGWVAKLDASGNILWQKLLGGSAIDYIYSMNLTADGGCILAGYSTSNNSGTLTGVTNNGGEDVWVVKLDAIGNVVWQKLLGNTLNEEAVAIKQTSDGGYIVAAYSASDFALLGEGNKGGIDYLVIKLDASGNTTWLKLYGGSSNDNTEDVIQTTDGGYIITGQANSSNSGTLTGFVNFGSGDCWIIKLNSSGTLVWQKLFGGSASDDCTKIIQTNDGGYLLAGSSASSNTGTLQGVYGNDISVDDYWIIKLDASGNPLWQRLMGGSYIDWASDVIQTADGGFILTGNTASTNTGTLIGFTNNGSFDCWVIKLDRYGYPL